MARIHATIVFLSKQNGILDFVCTTYFICLPLISVIAFFSLYFVRFSGDKMKRKTLKVKKRKIKREISNRISLNFCYNGNGNNT